MRVLVTGCGGALGSVLVPELRRRGHEVSGCDLTHSEDLQVMRADVAERRQMESVFANYSPKAVFHLAGEFGRANGENYPEQLWRTNVTGTHNVMRLCEAAGATLIFASSSEAYGDISEYAPATEDFKEEWLDKYAPRFHNSYSLSKWVNERQIFMTAQQSNLKAVVLRFFNCFGPGERYSPYRSVVCQFMYRLAKGLPITVYRESFRTHLYVEDWARTVANVVDPTIYERLFHWQRAWLGSGKSGVPVFNIGGREFESAIQLLERIAKAVSPKETLSVDQIATVLDREKANVVGKKPDCTAAMTWLDHNPRVHLDEGLRLTWAWMKQTYDL